MTDPDRPDLHDTAILEAAAAICPADHRLGGRSTEPPCGDCHATADAAVAAYQAHMRRAATR